MLRYIANRLLNVFQVINNMLQHKYDQTGNFHFYVIEVVLPEKKLTLNLKKYTDNTCTLQTYTAHYIL